MLTAKVIRHLLRIPINHIINVNFRSFKAAVDAIGCVYADVDRWYYHSNLGLPASAQYAEIDVSPGYQKLCGQPALDYVRFRHLDNDFVRAARQQDFLRQAKSQYGVSRFLADPHKLTKRVGHFIRTDASLQSKEEVLRLIYLAGYSATHPIREVHFPPAYENSAAGSFVTATPEALDQVRHEFLSPPPTGPKPKAQPAAGGGKRHTPKGPDLSGLTDAQTTSEDYAIQLGAVKLPVYYPKLLAAGTSYMTPERNARGQLEYPRAYRIKVPGGKMMAAYRLVVAYNTRRRRLLRHPGHELDATRRSCATPPATRARSRQETAAVLRRQAAANGRLEDVEGRLLGPEHLAGETDERPDARDRRLAHAPRRALSGRCPRAVD